MWKRGMALAAGFLLLAGCTSAPLRDAGPESGTPAARPEESAPAGEGWVPSWEARRAAMHQGPDGWRGDGVEVSVDDGAPLRAETVCGDYVWLLEHPFAPREEWPSTYDECLAAAFAPYREEAEHVRVLAWERLAGEPDSAAGAFRIRLEVERLVPGAVGYDSPVAFAGRPPFERQESRSGRFGSRTRESGSPDATPTASRVWRNASGSWKPPGGWSTES